MEEGTEGPHRVLTTELVTLDLILSFLDKTSQLQARRVCKSWNDCVLDKFHLKHYLYFDDNSDHAKGEIRSNLESVDHRLLTSLKIEMDLNEEKVRKYMWVFFNVLRSRGDEDCLVNLHLLDLDGEGFDYLIRLANEGRFRNLRKLYFKVELLSDDVKFKCLYRVNEAAFPKLQELGNFIIYYMKNDIQEAFQSFVSAAPNLTSIGVGTELDLSGLQKLKQLRIYQCDSLYDEDAADRMVQSVNRNLTSLELELYGLICPSSVVRNLPKLSKLKILGGDDNVGSLDWPEWGSLPNLRVLELSCNVMFTPEDDQRDQHMDILASFHPLPESLNEILLEEFPVEDEFWAVQ